MEKTPEDVDVLVGPLAERGVSEGDLILNMACGIGRVSIPLAKWGIIVVDLDLFPTYIGAVGDMRGVGSELSDYRGGLFIL